MKYILLALLTTFILNAQEITYQRFNQNDQLGFYPNLVNWEESAILLPPGPAKINTISVYLVGDNPGRDTIWVMQDPTDGVFPPSVWVQGTASYGGFIINYTNQGWYNLDVSDMNIYAGGINRIVVQHIIKATGPYFVFDANISANFFNWINDVFKPNPNFGNIAGSLYSQVAGDYAVILGLEYEFPQGNTSASAPPPQLVDVTSSAGLVVNNVPASSPYASVVDWNMDGFDDIATAGKFFQNNGDGTFSDVTTNLGISGSQSVWGDIDGDGFIDCFVVRGANGDQIFWGNENGTFNEDTDETIQLNRPTITPILFDYDIDGDLDIFVANGRTEVNGQETYFQDALFRNDGNRVFTNVTLESGIAAAEPAPHYDCWGASVTDFNNDGFPDIYVNTYRLAPDLLYRNNGNGTFTEVGVSTGARGAQTGNPIYFGHGMGSDWGDFDNDGDVDVAIGNLGHPDSRGYVSNKSLIFENDFNNSERFIDRTTQMQLLFFEMNAGILWVDLNQDGYLDLVQAQYAYYKKGTPFSGTELKQPDKNTRIYINLGPDENYRLKDMTWQYGAYIHGAWCPVRLDYDNDGDMDLLIASNQENIKLFRNDIDDKGHFVSFRLSGSSQNNVNNNAFGSSIKIGSGDKTYMRQLPGTVHNGRSSQSSNLLHFGLGDISSLDYAEITFSDGKVILIKDPSINTVHYVSWDGASSVNSIENSLIKLNSPTPNPSNGETLVQIVLENDSKIKLEIVNISGKSILSIFEGFALNGINSYSFNVSSLPVGSYRITALVDGIRYSEQLIVQ